jgi:hypothetical protein
VTDTIIPPAIEARLSNLEAKMNGIDNKLDLVLSMLIAQGQPTMQAPVTTPAPLSSQPIPEEDDTQLDYMDDETVYPPVIPSVVTPPLLLQAPAPPIAQPLINKTGRSLSLSSVVSPPRKRTRVEETWEDQAKSAMSKLLRVPKANWRSPGQREAMKAVLDRRNDLIVVLRT